MASVATSWKPVLAGPGMSMLADKVRRSYRSFRTGFQSGVFAHHAGFAGKIKGSSMATLPRYGFQAGALAGSLGWKPIIRKVHGGWKLFSHKGKNLGGPYPTRAGAVHREMEVQVFKHMG